jgi:hypothetical protein
MTLHAPKQLQLILVLYLILAVTYSIVTPIGRGADEWAHYWYSQFIAQHGRLPANPAEREIAGYKSDWPPLYHLLAAGATAWIETDGPPTFKYREENIRRQLVLAQGPEAILHTEDELFPWQQEILVWHLGRFLSIAFSLGTLLVSYGVALEVFSRLQEPLSALRSTLALAAVAALAFNPRFLFTGMLFNYDGLTLFLASLFLWLSIRIVNGYRPWWAFWGLGGLAGLALITKYLAALLPVMIIVVALIGDKSAKIEQNVTPYVLRFTPFPVFRPSLIQHLSQAAFIFLLVISWWFSYLIVNFNEIDRYGPILGVLAPLLRGDGSDRTVEELFAFLSGGQAAPPAHIEKQSYPAWQILAELPTTFWGNPVTRPYSLNWFVVIMTVVAVLAAAGLIIAWRGSSPGPTARTQRRLLGFLLLFCLLPLPFMLVRLFGARDALEAVQGRHILFLAGPAVAILLVWGLVELVIKVLSFQTLQKSAGLSLPAAYQVRHPIRLACCGLMALLLIGAMGQLLLLGQAYPPPLPVRTQPYPLAEAKSLPEPLVLENGATMVAYQIASGDLENKAEPALQVSLFWQAGSSPAVEDYQMELALVDAAGGIKAGWQAYQTQARYPGRAWEAGDMVRDDGWLPLVNLPAGDYQVRMRLLAEAGPITDWQTLATYTLGEAQLATNAGWVLWRQGRMMDWPPLLRERETAQFSFAGQTGQQGSGWTDEAVAAELTALSLQLRGPNGVIYAPVSAGGGWANFIIGPDWPAGDYYALAHQDAPLFRVAESRRNFETPAIGYPLEVNFEGKIKLLGYDLPSRRARAGDGLPITLYWQGLEWLGEEFVIFNRLLDNQQAVRGGYDRLARENYSTLLWAPGEIIVDGFAVPIAADAPDGVYTLSLGWYRKVDGEAKSLAILHPETGEATETTAITIGPVKVGGPPPGFTVDRAEPQTELQVMFGEQIKLLGFDLLEPKATNQPLSSSSLAACPTPIPTSLSCSLKLTFYWQAVALAETDYTAFIHLRNSAGEVVVQKDQPPLMGRYPTSLWDTGEIIKDELTLPLERLAPGRYQLVAGMYDFTTGMRLPVEGSPDATVPLQSFEVVAE